MKITAFNGSPRKGGNTELLLNSAIQALQYAGHQMSLYVLNDLRIKPCQDCGCCTETGICVYRDDMAGIYEAIRSADRIILASPIFFYGLSAQAKLMVDRCQPFWCEKYLLKKAIPAGVWGRRGLLLLVGGMTKGESPECAGLTAKAFFRTVSVPDHETLAYRGVDEKGAVVNHPSAIQDAYEAGRRLGE